MRNAQNVFACLIAVQFLFIAIHDLVDIPGLTHGRQIRSIIGSRKLALMSLANSIFPGVAVFLALRYFDRPAPHAAEDYWLIYCGVTVVSAIAMWYIPYIKGGTEKQRRDYAAMYAGTRHILPPRGDNPRPNLFHLCFHALFLATLAFAALLRFG